MRLLFCLVSLSISISSVSAQASCQKSYSAKIRQLRDEMNGEDKGWLYSGAAGGLVGLGIAAHPLTYAGGVATGMGAYTLAFIVNRDQQERQLHELELIYGMIWDVRNGGDG